MRAICTRCGKNPAVEGKTKCLNCLDYEAVAQYTRYCNLTPEQRKSYHARINESQKKRRKVRRDHGVCTKCGKRKADTGYVTCKICRAEWRERRRKYYLQTKGGKK